MSAKPKYTTEAEVESKIDQSVGKLNNFMWGVVVVLLISFIGFVITVTGLVIEVYQSRIDATNDLQQSVNQLNVTLRYLIPTPASVVPDMATSTKL